ncbi:MAG: Acetyltransferase [Candidatus Levybacteria bacterium GW2011_GWB1_35_5]|nr:MAG: Acetyltransferase [Candidatus Levybacteria bacterium GW2011_GWB1_35_5]
MKRIYRRLKTVFWEFVVAKLRLAGYIPSHHIRRFFYRFWGIKIGSGSTLHMGAVFYYPPNISIGKDSIIGENAVLDGRDRLTIGDHVDIASDVMIYNSQHDTSEENFAGVENAVKKPVTIEDYVFIGPRAIILPGVTVKTKDVEEFKIVGGVPAKEIGERENKNPTYKLGRAAWFR